MPWTIACTSCAKQLRLPETLVGQSVRCPSCHSDFVVSEASGRIAIQRARPGTAPLIAPVPRPAPSAPATPSGAKRAFVFRIQVAYDPEHRLTGELQARVSGGGLELRDRRGQFYDIPVGSKAIYLGGNRLSVDLGSRMLELRIDQRYCQRAALAADLVAFLSGRRGELRLGDYRPRRAVRLLALVPLLLPITLILLHEAGRMGLYLWTAFGVAGTGLSLVLLRAESIALTRRLAWMGAFWIIGLVLALAGLPHLRRAELPPLTWRSHRAADDKWTVEMPGQARERNSGPGVSVEVKLPGHEIDYEVRTKDIDAATFDGLQPAAHFSNARDAFLRAHRGWTVAAEAERILEIYPARDYWARNGTGVRAALRVVVVRPRVYVLKVISQDELPHENVRRFFDSFRLLPAGQAGPAEILGRDEPTPVPADRRRGRPPWSPRMPALPAPPTSPKDLRGGGLMGYWKFDEGQGNLVRDASGFAQHGTLHGGWWIEGVQGRAVMFDGRGDFFDFGDAKALNVPAASGWSVALWMATHEGNGVVLSQRNSLGAGPLFDVLVENGSLKAAIRQDGLAVDPSVVLGTRVDDGVWHHVAVVRNPFGLVQVFVDGGVQNGAEAQTNFHVAGGPISTHWRTLGRECWWARWDQQRDGRSFFNGCVDEFCIFNRDLQADEVRLLAGQQ
jgi:hypothetical protein